MIVMDMAVQEAMDQLPEIEHLGTFHVTAYAYTGSRCAGGPYPTEGRTVACNSLPFGTEIYIEDVGFRIVEDRGAKWHAANWCDLYLGDVESCIQWGNQEKEILIIKR